MHERRFDVVVVGAGPAGSTTALRLARAGFSVAIVDAARFPRWKPCGEFMSPGCLPLLRELGVYDEVAALGARPVRGMVLHAADRRASGRFTTVGRATAPSDYGWAVRRERFDEVLLRAAQRTGAIELFEQTRVTGLLRDAHGTVDGVTMRGRDGGSRELRAHYTIGADGVHSQVASELGVRRETPWLRKLAFTTRYGGVAWGDRAEVHLFPGGFVACAPVDGGLVSVNLVLDRELWRRERAPRDALLDSWLARLPAIGPRLASGHRVDPVRGIGSMACTTTRQVFAGAALVGDACGYVDPVTGEGIFLALKGAELLARSVTRALHTGRRDAAALAPYARDWRREIAPHNRLATLLQRGLRRPRVVATAFRLFDARPQLVDLLVSVTGDYVPTRELWRPGVWLRALARPIPRDESRVDA